MLNEMVLNMPTTYADLLKVTQYTAPLFTNYKGDELLTILKSNSKLLNDVKLMNDMDNCQNKVSSSELENKQPSHFENNQIFDDENDENDWLTSTTSSNSNNKRYASNASFEQNYSKKKAKVQNDLEDTSSYFNNSSSNNTQKNTYKHSKKKGYFGKQKKKFQNFKKYKK
jgi:hypothetical protein